MTVEDKTNSGQDGEKSSIRVDGSESSSELSNPALAIRLEIRSGRDLAQLRYTTREEGTKLGFGTYDLTRISTAASELGRNVLSYASAGAVTIESLRDGERRGLRLTFVDSGPGIADLDQALVEGFSSGGNLGLGLGGARRLVDEFEIRSKPGEGTWVCIVKWCPEE